jgi:iron complex transport system ATP-binding protein
MSAVGTQAPSPLFECLDLEVSIAGIQVSHQLGLRLLPGDRLAVLGPNGVGKTTLLHTWAGLRQPDAGSIRLLGDERSRLPRRQAARRLALLMQRHEDPFPSNALETVLIGRHPHIDFWRWESAEDERIARDALARVGLAGMAERDVATLSGGERRRLAIATVLAQTPGIYLLDEPTNHLDLRHQIEVLELFSEEARDRGRVVVMSLHDVNLAARWCDQVLMLFGDGDWCAGVASDMLTETALSRLYDMPVRRVESDGETLFVPERAGRY